jgi:hypothetical protein
MQYDEQRQDFLWLEEHEEHETRKISIWGMNNRMTNVFNVHTCAIGRIDLVVSIVCVLHSQLLEISYHMICYFGVGIPI